MTIEEKLKVYILENYCSMANFSNVVNISPATLSAIFKRGLENCSVSNLYKISDALDISIDFLRKGEIRPKNNDEKKKAAELNRIIRLLSYAYYFTIDNKPLSDTEIDEVNSNSELIAEILRKKREERDRLSSSD